MVILLNYKLEKIGCDVIPKDFILFTNILFNWFWSSSLTYNLTTGSVDLNHEICIIKTSTNLILLMQRHGTVTMMFFLYCKKSYKRDRNNIWDNRDLMPSLFLGESSSLLRRSTKPQWLLPPDRQTGRQSHKRHYCAVWLIKDRLVVCVCLFVCVTSLSGVKQTGGLGAS